MGVRFFEARKLALYTILIVTSLVNIAFSGQTASPKEALLLRRITEYWKDGDYATVKRQIIDFLEKNPDTALQNHLSSMLGDLYFQERNFKQALSAYELINDPKIQEKIFFNHIQAHFEMRDYLPVIAKGETHLREQKSDAPNAVKLRYLVAEACFRYSLNCSELEKKVAYLKLAKPHYKILSQTSYSNQALFPLAEIHRLLREDDRAAALYLQLAEKHPEHKERFLFQAAILQIRENKLEAINSFFKVHQLGGKRSRLAAFNTLILMYQTEQYDDFLSFHKDVINLMPEKKVPLLNFYEGRCQYALGNYDQAIVPLENFIASAKDKSKDLKVAYLLLVNCSRHLKDIGLLDRILCSYQSTFPKDPVTAKMLVIHAQMCRDDGNFAQALADLKTLVETYPDHEEAENATYDSGLLLSQTEEWKDAREMFYSFINKYPQSKRAHGAWRHLLNCSIEEVKDPNQSDPDSARKNFMLLLRSAMEHENILTEQEHKQYLLIMMKCQCELGQYEEVAASLPDYIEANSDKNLLAEAHLLMAICQQKLNKDPSLFIEHAEYALQHNPKLIENKILHLQLYNAYLTKGLSETDKQDSLYAHSAEHLFASDTWKDNSIKLDNYLWLANYYYQEAVKGSTEKLIKAKTLYDHLIRIKGLNFSPDSLYLEAEVMKYAHLLKLNKQRKEQISLLENLVGKQAQQPELSWKLAKRATLELALAYETDGQVQSALNLYQQLVSGAGKTSSIVANTAQLHLSKLNYRRINPMEKTADNPEVVSILHTLKDLQIQKKLLSEPLHLEAALTYAEIRCNMASPDLSAKNSHFFYKRMFEDFNNTKDPITDEYFHLKETHPEKDAIFTAYMDYLKAQMFKCKAEMALIEKNRDQAVEFKDQATQILNTLMQNQEHLQPYLFDRIKRTRMEITGE